MPAQQYIEINQSALDAIAQEVANRTVEELKTVGDDGVLLLKKIAFDFLSVVQQNLDKIKLIESYQLKLKQKRHELNYSSNPKDPAIVTQYNNFKQQLQQDITVDHNLNDFFKACLIFNDRILEVITGKQTRITVVIPVANDDPIILDYSTEQLLSESSGVSFIQDITSGKIPRITGRLSYDINKMKANFQNALKSDQLIENKQLASLNQTYNSALFDNFYKFQNSYVFWKPLSAQHWFKMKISGGAGDISEAYAYFFYKGKDLSYSFASNHLYDNLDVFFRQGVAKVDNISGLYSSDILDNKYNYAVKSLQASLPGYMQMLRLAQNILNGKVKTASQLKEISLRKQYKDPIKRLGEKGLRNKAEEILNKNFSPASLTK